MAVLWVGAVVFLVLLFLFVNPARNYGGGGQAGYTNRNVNYVQPQPQQQQPFYQQQTYMPAQNRGCQPVLALLFVVLLLFVGAVLFWSVSVQAGGW